jgi:hypothetical protein
VLVARPDRRSRSFTEKSVSGGQAPSLGDVVSYEVLLLSGFVNKSRWRNSGRQGPVLACRNVERWQKQPSEQSWCTEIAQILVSNVVVLLEGWLQLGAKVDCRCTCGRDGACFRSTSASGVSFGVCELAPHLRNRVMYTNLKKCLGREGVVEKVRRS